MAFKRIQFFVLGAGYAFGATVNTTETTKEFMQLVMKKMLKKIAQGAKADVESDDEDVGICSSGDEKTGGSCKLYVAKGPGFLRMDSWLRLESRFAKRIKRGELPWWFSVVFLTERNQIEIGEAIVDEHYGFPVYGVPGTVHVLIGGVPEHILQGLRLVTANQLRYYKMEHAQERLQLFAQLRWVCAVVAVLCAAYLYAVDENALRGFVDDFTSGNGRMWTVAIERLGLWLFSVLAVVMQTTKDSYANVRATLEKRIDYAVIIDVV
ncbi:hypothetical protein PInf_015239 [Phytophthora infestans]|nr:hypothetical protein PInf_015239 [Phytophthora infestans]